MNIGFMDPNGKMYICDSYGHLDLAESICDKYNYIDEIKQMTKYYSRLDCEQYLIAKGYLAIYSRSIEHGCHAIARINDTSFQPIKLSEYQEKFIRDNLSNAFNSEQLSSMYILLDYNDTVDDRLNYFSKK